MWCGDMEKVVELTEVNKEKVADALVALFGARMYILEGRKALRELPEGPECMWFATATCSVLSAGFLITRAFGCGELRDKAYKVLAALMEEDIKKEVSDG